MCDQCTEMSVPVISTSSSIREESSGRTPATTPEGNISHIPELEGGTDDAPVLRTDPTATTTAVVSTQFCQSTDTRAHGEERMVPPTDKDSAGLMSGWGYLSESNVNSGVCNWIVPPRSPPLVPLPPPAIPHPLVTPPSVAAPPMSTDGPPLGTEEGSEVSVISSLCHHFCVYSFYQKH